MSLGSGGLVGRRPLESNRLTSKEKRGFPDGRAAGISDKPRQTLGLDSTKKFKMSTQKNWGIEQHTVLVIVNGVEESSVETDLCPREPCCITPL